MVEFKFSDAHLSNLLFWQVKCNKTPSVFWIKPTKSGSTVYTYDDRGDDNPERFKYFPFCPEAGIHEEGEHWIELRSTR